MLENENRCISSPNYKMSMEIVQKAAFPNTARSLFEYFFCWFIYIGNCILIYYLLEQPIYFIIPFTIIQSLILVRLFILQHDCGHHALFKQHWLNNFGGILCSLISSITFHFWKDSHAVHHKVNGNFSKRPWIGDIEILTIKEFASLSPSEQKSYLFKRNIFVVLAFGWIYHIYNHRIYTPRFKNKLMTQKHFIRIHLTNLFQLLFFVTIAIFISPKFLIFAFIIPMIFGLIFGIFLFFIQHNFERSYFYFDEDKNINKKEIYMKTAVQGSSCLILPSVLRWFTGNIGYHHIHHISAKVPFYKLNVLYNNNPELHNVFTLTLMSAVKQFAFVMYDTENEKLITYSQYCKFLYNNKLLDIQNKFSVSP